MAEQFFDVLAYKQRDYGYQSAIVVRKRPHRAPEHVSK